MSNKLKYKVYIALGNPICATLVRYLNTPREANLFMEGIKLGSGYNDLKVSRDLSEVTNYVKEHKSNFTKEELLKGLLE